MKAYNFGKTSLVGSVDILVNAWLDREPSFIPLLLDHIKTLLNLMEFFIGNSA